MHTEGGLDMIKHFLTNISALKPDWTMDQVLEEQIRKINELVSKTTTTKNMDVSMMSAGVHASANMTCLSLLAGWS